MSFISTTLSIIFWFVVILIPLVAVHEFGHLFFSKLFKVKIPEYAIGLPLVRRTFFKRAKGTIWSFYWPLLGGFVRIYGDNDAIDEAHLTAKTDPKKAREDYISNRFMEIISSRELEFFLKDNGLEYNQEWKNFEKSKYASGKTDPSEKNQKKDYQRLYNQLATLIEWELDQNLNSKNTFYSKTWLQQTLIIFGGIIFNMLSAVFLFWILFTIVSINNTLIPISRIESLKQDANITSQSNYILAPIIKGGKAAQAGMENGDKLESFAGTDLSGITTQDDFRALVNQNKGREVEIVYYKRNTNEKVVKTVSLEDQDGQVMFGIGQILREIDYKAKGPISGFKLALTRTGFITTETFKLLGEIALAPFPGQNKEVLNYVGGPIGVGSIGSTVFAQSGIGGIIEIMGVVSISLAAFNMLPIPALDGGRWLIITINKLTGKRNKKLETAIIGITFIIMILLAGWIAFMDIVKVATGNGGI